VFFIFNLKHDNISPEAKNMLAWICSFKTITYNQENQGGTENAAAIRNPQAMVER
jgi:hypothetical protein